MKLIHEKQLLDGDTTPAMFIRFNPHTFLKHGVKERVSTSDKVQAEQARSVREERLIKAITQAQFGAKGGLRVLYMYYNSYQPLMPGDDDHMHHLNIWLNPAYCKEVRDICMPVIVKL